MRWVEPRGKDCSEQGARRALLVPVGAAAGASVARIGGAVVRTLLGVVLLRLLLLSLGQALVHTLLNECPGVPN